MMISQKSKAPMIAFPAVERLKQLLRMKYPQTDNTAELVEEMDMVHKKPVVQMVKKHRPHIEQPHHQDNRMPIDLTKELVLEVHQAAAKVADIGVILDRLPQAERIVAALMELRDVVAAVLAEQVNR